MTISTDARAILPFFRGIIVCGLFVLLVESASAADSPSSTNYAVPAVLSGKIYSTPDKKLLFTFRRTVTVTNSTVVALREFKSPDGTLVAREVVTYVSNKLAVFELTEPPNGAQAKDWVRADPRRAGQSQMVCEYNEGGEASRSSTETLQPDTLNADMIGPFINDHWVSLLKGESVKFRFVAVSRRETIGFRFIKDSESKRDGKSVVILRMEPTSMLISPFVDPLYFTVEKSTHRVLDYTGRTTPRIKEGGEWKDIVAFTTFDWTE